MSAFATAADLNIVLFSESPSGGFDELAQSVCAEADLVVALGNIDLLALAQLLSPRKPALCVRGDKDRETTPPAPFRALDGAGVTFKEWRIAGISGARRLGSGGGFVIDEDEARSILKSMPSCDILISHAPPAGLPLRGRRHIETGLYAIREYISAHEPIYSFYSHDGEEHVDDEIGSFESGTESGTWTVGVSGMLYLPALRFV
jgi:Icc-related predicted phosphoesterase